MDWSTFLFAAIKWGVVVLLAVSNLHQWLYGKSPKYYLFVLKLISRWKDTYWKISAVYEINRSEDFFKEFEKILKSLYNCRKTLNLNNRKIYEFDIFSLTVQYDLDFSESEIVKVEMHFQKVNITYQNSIHRLEELQRLFHKLDEKFNFLNKTYNFDIEFGNKFHNPFYGVAIRHLGEEHIKNFECSFDTNTFDIRHERHSENIGGIINVFKNGVSITNSDFDVAKICAKKCLLLE